MLTVPPAVGLRRSIFSCVQLIRVRTNRQPLAEPDRDSKHTVEGDSCPEEGNIGILDITHHWQGGKEIKCSIFSQGIKAVNIFTI